MEKLTTKAIYYGMLERETCKKGSETLVERYCSYVDKYIGADNQEQEDVFCSITSDYHEEGFISGFEAAVSLFMNFQKEGLI